jgi:hypothetical protein
MAKPKVYVTQEPVVLNGFQAVFQPSEYGYSLAVDLTDPELIQELEADRETLVAAKLETIDAKKRKRASLKPTPWEENEDGTAWNVKFKWDDSSRPPIVDAQGTLIRDTLKLFSGSTVRVGFTQTSYILKDGITYGTKLNIKSIQVISVGGKEPSMSAEAAADLFGTFEGGFVAGNIPDAAGEDEDGEEGDGDF